MKTKLLFILTTFLFSKTSEAQDYFVIIKKNDEVTYNYPQNVTMNLYDEDGNITTIREDDAIDVTGNYILKIDVPWRDKPEIIESEGGRLEIFKLPKNIRSKDSLKSLNKVKTVTSENDRSKTPKLERREVFVSETNPDEFDLLVTFSNSLTVRVFEGKGRAWQNSQEIKVENHYLVQTDEGLLKLSFNKKTGETWWVWEM